MNFAQALETAAIIGRNMIVGTNLAALSLARQPRTMLMYASECLFLYKTLAGTRRIPQRNVFDVLPIDDTESITVGNLRKGLTWFFFSSSYIADLVSLCMICRAVKPKVVFEIGTFTGYTALHFALNSPEEARIYTLDLPKGEVVPKLRTTTVDRQHVKEHAAIPCYIFDQSPAASKITCLAGDSATFDFTPFHHTVDFFFIDGAHSYEYVRSDTLNALQCCHPGSVIAWHDFGRVGVNGVSRWICELSSDHDIYAIPGGSLAFMVVKSVS
jgi:predicted O-methyltransferase YrrM